VGQSAEEALNSLVEEMKEMLTAPVYNMTPLQDVSEKFWSAMAEARRQNTRREKRLEQSLAKIKAEFLMAREEHEEQLSAERAGAAPAPSPPARASCCSGANLCRGRRTSCT
jgi:chromosome segregation ATPase